MERKKAFIKTFGCQMNVNDSERIKGILTTLGYELTKNWQEADLILLNTCTVREKPDRKVLAYLGEYKKIKKYTLGIQYKVLEADFRAANAVNQERGLKSAREQ